jgi:hypothetical protein
MGRFFKGTSAAVSDDHLHVPTFQVHDIYHIPKFSTKAILLPSFGSAGIAEEEIVPPVT